MLLKKVLKNTKKRKITQKNTEKLNSLENLLNRALKNDYRGSLAEGQLTLRYPSHKRYDRWWSSIELHQPGSYCNKKLQDDRHGQSIWFLESMGTGSDGTLPPADGRPCLAGDVLQTPPSLIH